MLDLYELEQLTAFADLGTLAAVAEKFHLSTPSVTRSMQHLEDAFGVTLFTRGKNRIALNETGQTAVECARKLLREESQAVAEVRACDARQRTIIVKSCAPAPLWELLPKLSAHCPGQTISSEICQNQTVQSAWEDGECDIAILPFAVAGAQSFMKESLFVCVPKGHELARHKTLTFAEINGFNFCCAPSWAFGMPCAAKRCRLPGFWCRPTSKRSTSWCRNPPCPASAPTTSRAKRTLTRTAFSSP